MKSDSTRAQPLFVDASYWHNASAVVTEVPTEEPENGPGWFDRYERAREIASVAFGSQSMTTVELTLNSTSAESSLNSRASLTNDNSFFSRASKERILEDTSLVARYKLV
ncbi:MAG: hypothetical protein ING73_16030 [Rhodocyclaceae bacterium]|nr:hypothetical protein [Rhodocyclaceae bacterium]MCA3077462.1 hypothetical protein [Rhodocyclaceae bacterium]MCA3085950.1 hypothetical protein [Rhodocyclaceae bacterium]